MIAPHNADVWSRALSLEVLNEAISHSLLEGRNAVLELLPEIYPRYVAAIDPPISGPTRPS